MSAETELLREAARVVRERTEASSPYGRMVEEKSYSAYGDGPAYADTNRWAVCWDLYPHHEVAIECTREDAEFIATWDPAVALAVADLLDRWVWMTEKYPNERFPGSTLPQALAIARAILRREE